MRLLAILAFTTVTLAQAPAPPASFRWQRTVTPPVISRGQAACLVLDTSSFSHAQPGLRDLRLFQDGDELPYAVEESFDQRALEHDSTPPDDRSLYEIADREPMFARQPGGVAGDGRRRSIPSHRLFLPDEPDSTAGYFTDFRLPPQVPVERLRLDPAPNTDERISLTASPVAEPRQQETISGTVTPSQPAMPVTLGANLQTDARIHVSVEGTDHVVRSVLLEMRRRSLCYQPRSASALTLYLGNAALPAPQYDYARHFSADTPRPLASLGPLQPNPAFRPPEPEARLRSRHAQWQLAILASASLCLLSATHLLNTKKSPVR